MKKQCLITGGAGFIGSHLCEELLRLGYDVVCVDNLITGNKENIGHLLPDKHFSFVQEDILSYKLNIKPDIIFHLASPASPIWYQAYPVETLLVNTLGTKVMLDVAREANSVFVYASTSEVYGDPQIHPQVESYWGNVNPNGVRACYDEAKRCGEAFVMTYHRMYQIDARIIRIFNTYGPRMDKKDGRVISNLIVQAIAKQPLSIYGDGQQTRSFCFVTDLVEGLIKMATIPQGAGEIVNLGNPEELTINQVHASLEKILGKSLQVEHKPLPQDDPIRRKPDISKAQRMLSWNPKVTLEEGLKKTIEYFQGISL